LLHRQFTIWAKQSNEDTVELIAVDGVLEIKDQLKQYVNRGESLEPMNLLGFFLNTYETDAVGGATLETSSKTKPGPKAKERIGYLEGSGHGSKRRMVRNEGHETIPNFVGDLFPPNNVEELQDFYHASMLALLKPWRDLTQSKAPGETFAKAFSIFVSQSDESIRNILDNIQYHHVCVDSVHQKRQQQMTEEEAPLVSIAVDDTPQGGFTQESVECIQEDVEYCQCDVDNTLAAQFAQEDRLFAEVALNIAADTGIWGNTEESVMTEWKPFSDTATMDDMSNFSVLERLVQEVTKDRSGPDKRNEIHPDLDQIERGKDISADVQVIADHQINLDHASGLNEDQCMAHDIVANNLRAHLEGRLQKQILMIVIGQGGMGKSTLLNTMMTTFEKQGAPHLLAKTALTGVAASLIGGTTLYWFAGLPAQKTPQSDVWPDNAAKYIRDRRSKNLIPPLWLTIDEAGMCTLDQLMLLSQVCSKARTEDGRSNATVPFGGMNIILIADFHQFPPVGGNNVALYCQPVQRNTAMVGKAVYLQFETVVILTKQWRI
jgi:hypothetical protein